MRHYLSLCAIFKNEADYLEEWLRFYDLLGVEHFYLFDNGSTDNPAAIFAPWKDAGRITTYSSDVPAVQLPAYRHCIQTHGRDSKWIMFLDLDEYLFSLECQDLREFLRDFESEAGVVANWLMFGANGHRQRPSGLTMLNYTRRCETGFCSFQPEMLRDPRLDPRQPASYHKVCDHIKSIVNTEDVVDVGYSPHGFRYRDGRKAVNANHRPVDDAFCEDHSSMRRLRINHYFSRSWEELEAKLHRGRADNGKRYDPAELRERNRHFDEVVDVTIAPLARKVEAAINARQPPAKSDS
jgi:hypothetical protein